MFQDCIDFYGVTTQSLYTHDLCPVLSHAVRFGGGGDANKMKSLAELFKPPHDIMFHGTFHEVTIVTVMYLYLPSATEVKTLYVPPHTGKAGWSTSEEMAPG